MKLKLFALSLITLSLNCSANQPEQGSASTDTAAAMNAIKSLAGALQTELKAAMQAGGPVAAIAVCNTRAMPITQQLSAEHELNVSRVSLKNRNPLNLSNEWQTAVLKEFERQRAAGEDVTKLTWSETADVEGKQEFRFMKAIPTAEICLKCHGTALVTGVSEVLAELYPEDRATGYSKGDIRGAFVVVSNP